MQLHRIVLHFSRSYCS